MKKVLLAVFLTMIAINCSGCATILGGIIGYQSGEAVAGAAIGAAIDITGAIISHAREEEQKREKKEKDEEREKERKESINIYAEDGYIQIGSISAAGRNYSASLMKKFDIIGWQYSEDKEATTLGDEISRKIFECRTTDDRQFRLSIIRERDQDIILLIEPDERNNEYQSMVTSQIGIWVREIAGL